MVTAGSSSATRAADDPHRVRLGRYTVAAIAESPPGAADAVPLLDAAGAALGPRLDVAGFCTLAAQGAAVVGGATYRVSGTGREPQAFCGRYFSRLNRKQPVAAGALGRSRFERIESPHGIGLLDYRLVPFRTVAADRLAYPAGTVLFARALAGRDVGGRPHEGYLVVTDSIDGPHAHEIALYIGVEGRGAAPFGLPDTIEITVVTDPERIERERRDVRWSR